MEWTYLPVLTIGLPFVGSLLVIATSRIYRRLPYVLCIASLVATVLAAIGLAWGVISQGPLLLAFPETGSPSLVLNADGLGTIMSLLSSFLCLASALVSRSYGAFEKNQVRYSCSILILSSTLNGIFLSGDLLLMMIFWEFMILASYLLVIHSAKPSSLAAGRKYFIMAQAGAIVLVLSVVIAFSQTGTLRMDGGLVFGSKMACLAFAALAFLGFGIDAAVIPFHIWLPDAHSESPTPISAILSGIVVKTGIYGMVRFFYLISELPSGLPNLIVPLGLTTAFVGGFLALFQMDGKRLIAMSTMSQIGLIVMGLGSGLMSGATGAVFHLINHSLFKSLLFLSAGWVMWSAGTRNLRAVGPKVGGRSRWVLPFYVVGLLSISGIPPLNGFFSKSVIAKAVQVEFPLLATLSTLIGMLTLLSFMKLGWYLFFREADGSGGCGPSRRVIIICATLAGLCIVQGAFAPTIIRAIDDSIGDGYTTPIPSIVRPSSLTVFGYLGSLFAIIIWVKKRAVYNFFTEGPLRGIGWLARKELFIDSFFVSFSRLVIRFCNLLSRSASGSSRDYMGYMLVAWLVGSLFILGGML